MCGSTYDPLSCMNSINYTAIYCQAARRRCPERSPVPRLQEWEFPLIFEGWNGMFWRVPRARWKNQPEISWQVICWKCGEHAIREIKRGGLWGALALMSYRPPNIRPKTQNDIINSQTNSPKWKNRNIIYIIKKKKTPTPQTPSHKDCT